MKAECEDRLMVLKTVHLDAIKKSIGWNKFKKLSLNKFINWKLKYYFLKGTTANKNKF